MEGPTIDDARSMGIIPRMVTRVFDMMYEATANIEFTIKVSMIEIYLERIRDLLDVEKTNLQVHEDTRRGVYVEDATEEYVSCPEDVYQVMRYGASLRATASTSMNDVSSRSHSIFMMEVRQRDTKTETIRTGKLFLVDLAGSEKVRKTNAAGERLEEAKNINKSLSALGNVIYALTDPKSTHTPYRDSKLTRILEQSLGGNSKTCLVLACSPSAWNEQETLSTLRFGARAKMIKNRATINQEFTAEQLKIMLAQAEAEIERLKALLESGGISSGLPQSEEDRHSMLQLQDALLDQLKEKTEETRRLKDDYADLKADLNRASTAHEAEIAHLKQTIDSLKAQLSEAKRDLASAADKIKSQDDELLDKDRMIEMLTAPREAEDENQTQANKITELEALVELQRKELQALERANEGNAGSHKTSLTDLLATKEVENEKYKARIKEQEARSARLLTMIRQHQERERQFQAIVKQLHEAHNKLRTDFNASMQDAVAHHTQALQQARDESESLRSSNDTLSQELETLRLAYSKLSSDLKERCDKVVELEMRLDREQEQNVSLIEKGGVKNPNNLKRTMDFLQRNLEQYSNVCQQLLLENHQLNHRSNTLDKSFGEYSMSLATLADRFNRLRAVINDTPSLKQALVSKGFPSSELDNEPVLPEAPVVVPHPANSAAQSASALSLPVVPLASSSQAPVTTSFEQSGSRSRTNSNTSQDDDDADQDGGAEQEHVFAQPRTLSQQPSDQDDQRDQPKLRAKIAVPVKGGKKSSFEQSQGSQMHRAAVTRAVQPQQVVVKVVTKPPKPAED
eukprot:c52303_g1_i1.p1 GENE.c52303_g1_i1~~c52303_g1_i1.p1  ORF type:complete len:923 (+),score=222.47 c52303_g1_i1:368-2770(+)